MLSGRRLDSVERRAGGVSLGIRGTSGPAKSALWMSSTASLSDSSL